jgi:hypothetical protein
MQFRLFAQRSIYMSAPKHGDRARLQVADDRRARAVEAGVSLLQIIRGDAVPTFGGSIRGPTARGTT